jgi:hypothetical protein
MGMSNAQRQREYRRRNARAGLDQDVADREPVARINSMVDVSTAAALSRLAAHHGLTKRAMLEALVADAEAAIVSTNVDTGAYFAVTA